MFLKIGEISRRGDEKRKGEADTPFHTRGGATSQKFAHSPHLEKNFPSHMENPPVSRLPPPVLPNTKLLFSQASKPKPLN